MADRKAGILWQTNAGGVIEQAATIRPSEFSEGHVLRLCRSFLAAHRQAVVIRYLIVTDAQEALTNLRGPGITDIEFPGWRRFYLAQSRHPPPTAELIRIVDRASVRLRFLDGTIVERVIEGSSPLRIRFQGETVRILGVTADRANTPRGVPPETAHLFVEISSPWSLRTAEAFSRMIRKQTGLQWIQINIEDDWWFAGETNYPIYNRFLPYLEPPTFEEFKRHTRFFCADMDGRCLQTGPSRKYPH